MNHGLLLVLWYRGLQGHIWLKGQRANNLLSQITFSLTVRVMHKYYQGMSFFIAPGSGVSFLLLIKIRCDTAQTGDRQLTAGDRQLTGERARDLME